MVRRESIDLPGFGHTNPIPVASRKGPFLFSGAFTGLDPETHRLAPDLDTQIVNIFRHVDALMVEAGGTVDDIVKMTFWLASYRDRDALNREWHLRFPDPDSRPSRHVIHAALDGGVLVQADLTAVLDT